MSLLVEPSARASRLPFCAVFLDRDGVINENRVDHVKTWSEFRFLPGAREAIVRLTRAGCRLFVISNQASVNRGLVSQSVVEMVNGRMVRDVGRHGGCIEAIAYCPHLPEEACSCRKPQPGLLLNLAGRFGLELNATVLIGDALSDIAAGQAVGCRTILVLSGRGREQLSCADAQGLDDFEVADDLQAATDLLLGSPRTTI